MVANIVSQAHENKSRKSTYRALHILKLHTYNNILNEMCVYLL